MSRNAIVSLVLATSLAACGRGTRSQDAGGDVASRASAAPAAAPCASDNVGLTLPAGFCASIFADSVRGARHLAVAPNGDVFVAIGGRTGGLEVLRDENGDGRADRRVHFAGAGGGSEVALYGGYVYLENTTSVRRYRLASGAMEPTGEAEVVAKDLPGGGNHYFKTFTIARDGALYVNFGSATNACQAKDRIAGEPGSDPCVELEKRAGIWKFDARKLDQTPATGEHFARGNRNAVGITTDPVDGKLWATQHGRDQLGDWKKLGFSNDYNAENPAEELMQVNRGDDFGWPYCYYSVEERKLVLAPEYGGDGKKVGECGRKKEPVAVFPGHWAPNALYFYTGSQFPARYRNGAFIAFHGSWNRAPLEQAGFNVVFQPLDIRGAKATGAYEVFAKGFAGNLQGRGAGNHRPTGLAQAPDGSLYVSDDAGGRIYRISYTGTK